MGPDNPWSPNWRPDPSGRRLVAIRAARRGALLAGIVYLPVGAAVFVTRDVTDQVALVALTLGLPGVALLGAGLASSALGTRIEALITAIAFAIGAPVAAVTSLLIAALVAGALLPGRDLAGPVVRGGVMSALAVAPVVGVAAAVWVVALRRLGRSGP
jgi:hypothetical protein